MKLLQEKQLESGETMRILSWDSSEPAPDKYRDYILASFGMDHPNSSFYTINGWRGYFNSAMRGEFYPEVVDHWFFAEIDSVPAGRIWFAYSARTGRGNFGNVMTEPQFRRRGIMTELMKAFSEAFERSPARMLCCATGNRFAAASYLKYGFSFIFEGPTGPLCICKDGDFHSEAAKAFAREGALTVRPGTVGDQFDCDKFLAYLPEVWRRSMPGFIGTVPDFRMALLEQLGGRGTVMVAENSSGTVVGYAFAVRQEQQGVLDFMVHPDFTGGAAGLLQAVCGEFRSKFPELPAIFYYGYADDAEKLALIEAAGGATAGIIARSLTAYEGKIKDMIVCKF